MSSNLSLWSRVRRQMHMDGGQSLIETALMVPLMLMLAFNAINFGYYFVVAINLSSSAREAAQYSVEGFSSSLATSQPTPAAVNSQAIEDLSNSLSGSANVSVRVCTQQFGVNTTTHAANCKAYGGNSTWPTEKVDPEAPSFVLNEVDVVYTVSPIIPVALFKLQLMPSYTFTQHVYMRSMP